MKHLISEYHIKYIIAYQKKSEWIKQSDNTSKLHIKGK